jgi:hypothetical protein
MESARPRNVLPYRSPDDARRDAREELWGRVADVLVPVAYWVFVAVVVGAFLGAVVLWGMLISVAV